MLGQRVNSVLRTSLAGLCLLAIPSLARAADISDKGGFFSEQAITKANHEISEIEKKSGHEIQIETFATAPDGKAESVAKMDPKERDAFMQKWIKDRAQESKANGTVILICKDPGHIETWSSHKLKDMGFTQADHKRIKDAMIDGFRAKDYDGALKDTVSELSAAYSKIKPAHSTAFDRLNQNSAAPHRDAPARPVPMAMGGGGMGWTPIIFVLGVVIVGIFVISLISRLFGGGSRGYGGPGGGPGYGQTGYGQPGYGAGPGYGGGGGGFMQNLAGGLFGAVAGNWLYNSFGGGNSAHAGQTVYPPQGDSNMGYGAGPSQNDGRDFTGGGDFGGGGDAGGGGDFGGGGGDFGGGGDSGGSGGDFSGGGDF